MKDLIHFAHGNGFPSLCYSQFLQALSAQYDYCFIDKSGHHPEYPVTENWEYLVEELLRSIEIQRNRPVIAVGHSLGAVLSLLAATKRPALFKAVVMLDAPLLSPFKSIMVRLAKATGLIDNVTPAGKTKNRQQHWKTRAELMEYLKSRPLFHTFTEQCLIDYVQYGFKQDKDGFHLLFDRDIEYSIYRTIPHTLFRGTLKTPTALIYGDKSEVVHKSDRLYMANQFGMTISSVSGTHLFPFEIPEIAARKVMDILDGMHPD